MNASNRGPRQAEWEGQPGAHAAQGENDRGQKVGELLTTPTSAEGLQVGMQVEIHNYVTTYEETASDGTHVQKLDDFLTKQSENKVTEWLPQTRLPQMVPANEVGRPRKLTPELQQQVCLLLQAGFSRRQAAAYIHLAHNTITYAMNNDPEFAASIVRAEELGRLQTDLCVIAASRKNWRAAAWLIEHRRQHPAPPTEEEKQAKHQERLADQEREHELDLRRAAMRYDEGKVSLTGGKEDPFSCLPTNWPQPRTKRKKKPPTDL